MAKHFVISVLGDTDHTPLADGDVYTKIRGAINYLRGCIGGAREGKVILTTESDAVAATGTLTLATSSGVVGGTINGVLITVTWATSDTATAAAIAAAINASTNVLVSDRVSATSSGAVVTLTSKQPGLQGNAITLAASGTNVTASGALLTGGTAGTRTVTTL